MRMATSVSKLVALGNGINHFDLGILSISSTMSLWLEPTIPLSYVVCFLVSWMLLDKFISFFFLSELFSGACKSRKCYIFADHNGADISFVTYCHVHFWLLFDFFSRDNESKQRRRTRYNFKRCEAHQSGIGFGPRPLHRKQWPALSFGPSSSGGTRDQVRQKVPLLLLLLLLLLFL